uniref:Trehalase n=1 Tax=Nilaparvata lugens TaxID=108931 RepID=C8CGD2_NILLU|nr:membrane-bound trehalase [Nilaparvata lugens]
MTTVNLFTVVQVLLLAVLASSATNNAYKSLPPTCQSDIYCHGPLIHTVQMASIFPDSKTFVDMKMKYSRNETLRRFSNMMKKTDNAPSRHEVEIFVNETFGPAGSEFVDYEPEDWIQKPAFLEKVLNPDLRQWGSQLNLLWKFLGRKMKDDVKVNPEKYSIIYVPHPVIVPGGRFREFYYWDSYWIIRGLLYSQMYSTARGMIHNFVTIVDQYGFIPNGGRIYYAMRSQLPLLAPMVKSYLDVTHDLQFLKDNIHTLEKEFEFWMMNRTTQIEKDGHTYTLARYNDQSRGPRPESYREDYSSAQSFRTEGEKEIYYGELKTAAESGWDFSSRWFVLNGTNKGNLTNLKGSSIIPVELNAIIYWNAKLLAEFNKELGMTDKQIKYTEIAEQWLEAVTKVLWHEEVGAWLDYDIINEKKRDYFYPTNISPLWTNCYDTDKKTYFISKIMKYLEKTNIDVNQAGVPTTLEHSGEQWDYPNAWPPLQYILIMSLDTTGDEWCREIAYEFAERWVRSNYKAYNETNAMYEKYDATVLGGHGGGGEYEVQLGFGWTNGVITELLDKYGHKLTPEQQATAGSEPHTGASISASGFSSSSVSTITQLLTAILALLATFAAGCIGLLMYRRRCEYSSVRAASAGRRPTPDNRKKLLKNRIGTNYMELKDLKPCD